MKLVAIIKVIDEDSGLVVRDGDQINIEQVAESFSQGLRLYEFNFHLMVSTSLERQCEEAKCRKRLQKREEEKG